MKNILVELALYTEITSRQLRMPLTKHKKSKAMKEEQNCRIPVHKAQAQFGPLVREKSDGIPYLGI